MVDLFKLRLQYENAKARVTIFFFFLFDSLRSLLAIARWNVVHSPESNVLPRGNQAVVHFSSRTHGQLFLYFFFILRDNKQADPCVDHSCDFLRYFSTYSSALVTCWRRPLILCTRNHYSLLLSFVRENTSHVSSRRFSQKT